MFYIVGLETPLRQEMLSVLTRVTQGLRPHTRSQYTRQFKLFLAYVLTRGIRELDAVRTVLLFTEFLASNSISYRVIMNYISALKHMFTRYGWDGSVFSAPILNNLL